MCIRDTTGTPDTGTQDTCTRHTGIHDTHIRDMDGGVDILAGTGTDTGVAEDMRARTGVRRGREDGHMAAGMVVGEATGTAS